MEWLPDHDPDLRSRGRAGLFNLAKDPDDQSPSPKILATPGAHLELYGWEELASPPENLIFCEGEFDRLVLKAQGFRAVTSTGGAWTRVEKLLREGSHERTRQSRTEDA
jgi:hypothetical protein